MKTYNKTYLIILLIAHFYINVAEVKTKLLVPERTITRKEALQLLQQELSKIEVNDWELQKKKLEINQNQEFVDLPFNVHSFFGLLQEEQETGLAYSDFTRRLIISAPSGYGKNYLVKHIAKATKSRLVKLYRNNIDGCALNKTNLVKAVFDQAIELGEKEGIRTIICIDEITDFTRPLDMEEESNKFYDAVNEELWSHINKCKNNPYIVVIGIVRDNSKIDSFILKTFIKNIEYLYSLDDETRAKLIDFFAKTRKFDLPKELKTKLINESKDLSIRAIEEIFNGAFQDANLQDIDGDYFIQKFKEAKENIKKEDNAKKDNLDKAAQVATIANATMNAAKIAYDIKCGPSK